MLCQLSLPVEHRPQTTCPQPAQSCAAISIFLQLNLKPAVHNSLSRSLFQVFLGRPLHLWPCGIHLITCLTMLSSLHLSVCLIQFHILFWNCSKTGWSLVFFHSSLLVILSDQCIFRILVPHFNRSPLCWQKAAMFLPRSSRFLLDLNVTEWGQVSLTEKNERKVSAKGLSQTQKFTLKPSSVEQSLKPFTKPFAKPFTKTFDLLLVSANLQRTVKANGFLHSRAELKLMLFMHNSGHLLHHNYNTP